MTTNKIEDSGISLTKPKDITPENIKDNIISDDELRKKIIDGTEQRKETSPALPSRGQGKEAPGKYRRGSAERSWPPQPSPRRSVLY